MKFFYVLTVSLVTLFILSASAQNNQGNGPKGNDGVMGGGMMDSSKYGCMMKMHMMSPSTAFATSDGGFIIIKDNKIMKYDKDLNLKKEAEMKVDTMEMKHMMQQCPSMKSGAGSKDSSNMPKH